MGYEKQMEPILGDDLVMDGGLEDLFMWHDNRGTHMIVHSQAKDHAYDWGIDDAGRYHKKKRGAYLFSADGKDHWSLSDWELFPSEIQWDDGTTEFLLKQQRPSLISSDRLQSTSVCTQILVSGPTTTTSSSPTDVPTLGATTAEPTDFPTVALTTTTEPTSEPTSAPTTSVPTEAPTANPTDSPTTDEPTNAPTDAPIVCQDTTASFKWNKKKEKTCNWLSSRPDSKLEILCGKMKQNKEVYNWCPKTCLRVGLGKCSS